MTSMDPAPLRIWLEPGYDGGRCGTWLLDIPGAFGWGPTEDRALAGALSLAGRVREWREAHGHAVDLPPFSGLEVVERWAPDVVEGVERKSIFTPDLAPATAADVERTLAWIEDARADLEVLIPRLEAFEAAHGALPLDGGEREERPSLEVLRHLAGAEVFLLSRLDPSARYTGADRDAPLADHLVETRAWAVERLRVLLATMPEGEVADGRGERWTLRKVLRRIAYHSLDHLWELDRRLAQVDGTGDRVRVHLDRVPGTGDATALLRAVGWDTRTLDPERLALALETSNVIATAWDGDRLVGMGRSLTDHVFVAYLTMIVVHPRYQGLGVGRRLVEALTEGRDQMRFVLGAAPGVAGWYESFGFVPDDHALVRRRLRR